MKKGEVTMMQLLIIIGLMVIVAIVVVRFAVPKLHAGPDSLVEQAGQAVDEAPETEIIETKEQLEAMKQKSLDDNPEIQEAFEDLVDAFKNLVVCGLQADGNADVQALEDLEFLGGYVLWPGLQSQRLNALIPYEIGEVNS